MQKGAKMTGQTLNGNKRAPRRPTTESPVQSAESGPIKDALPSDASPPKSEWRNKNNAEKEFYEALGCRLRDARLNLIIRHPGKGGRTASLNDITSRLPTCVVNRTQLHKYETGESRPQCFVLAQLAEVLDVSVDYLLTGKE
jgi:hypothetical protein